MVIFLCSQHPHPLLSLNLLHPASNAYCTDYFQCSSCWPPSAPTRTQPPQ
ncbi:hypothetical protein Syun_011246 [Stephania yunnanensis]|uniref:Uncharacterized protein n=1 Tax=Stephania yunnanensis TaxID=152371 RepID=A0AAP0JX62_9MAGN